MISLSLKQQSSVSLRLSFTWSLLFVLLLALVLCSFCHLSSLSLVVSHTVPRRLSLSRSSRSPSHPASSFPLRHSCSLTYTPSLFLSHSSYLSLAFSHTLIDYLALVLSLSLTRCLCLSLSRALPHSCSFSATCSLSVSSLGLSRSLRPPTHPPISLALSLSLTTLELSLSHTRSLSHTERRWCSCLRLSLTRRLSPFTLVLPLSLIR